LKEFAVDREQPDASREDPEELEADEDEIDAQALLRAANRAIAAVRQQAAGLLRHRSDPHNDDEAPVKEPPDAN
jgi:hypothetical protein